MRLIKVPTAGIPSEIEFIDILGQLKESYGILSHTWGIGEVTYADVINQSYQHLQGYEKIKFAMIQAQKDGHKLLWVDTCCIDKSSSAELSEAINSMYSWYKKSKRCYAKLQDVTCSKDDALFAEHFANARWFTRGWTLQELLAPRDVIFYNKKGDCLGSKHRLSKLISNATNIQEDYITRKRSCRVASVARRLSWASTRDTTRIEDIAYCLLGLMDVNMPLLYGEEDRAFYRLQEEIMKVSDDQSLFLWKTTEEPSGAYSGLLASSPKDFKSSGDYRPFIEWEQRSPFQMTNRGLQIELDLEQVSPSLWKASLDCTGWPAIYLEKLDARSNRYARINTHLIGTESKGKKTTICVPQRPSDSRDTAVPYFPVRFKLVNQTPDKIVPIEVNLSTAYAINSGEWESLQGELTRQVLGNHAQSTDYTSAVEIACREGCAMRLSFTLHSEERRLQRPSRNIHLLVGVRRDTKALAFQITDRAVGYNEWLFQGHSAGTVLYSSWESEIVVQVFESSRISRTEFLCDIIMRAPTPRPSQPSRTASQVVQSSR